jgi:hypothetical protein
VGSPVTENSFSSDSIEGARVGYANAEVGSVASVSVAAIVGLSVSSSDPVVYPVTSTAEVSATTQSACQYRTACVASLDEQRFCRQGVISVMSSFDFEHWQEMSVASAQLLSARPVSIQYSCEKFVSEAVGAIDRDVLTAHCGNDIFVGVWMLMNPSIEGSNLSM